MAYSITPVIIVIPLLFKHETRKSLVLWGVFVYFMNFIELSDALCQAL